MAKRRFKKKRKPDQIDKQRADREKMFVFLARVYEMVRGGNPFGLGEWTLNAAKPGRG